MIDRAGLEIRYTPFGYRGFESLTLRKASEKIPHLPLKEFYEQHRGTLFLRSSEGFKSPIPFIDIWRNMLIYKYYRLNNQ